MEIPKNISIDGFLKLLDKNPLGFRGWLKGHRIPDGPIVDLSDIDVTDTKAFIVKDLKDAKDDGTSFDDLGKNFLKDTGLKLELSKGNIMDELYKAAEIAFSEHDMGDAIVVACNGFETDGEDRLICSFFWPFFY